jgi:hypothetical protein
LNQPHGKSYGIKIPRFLSLFAFFSSHTSEILKQSFFHSVEVCFIWNFLDHLLSAHHKIEYISEPIA